MAEMDINELFDDEETDAEENQSSTYPFEQLVRVETRLRPEQYTQLRMIVQHLSSQKEPGIEERLTQSTVIRVAMDLLISRADELEGSTEEELLESLGLQ